VILAHEVAAYLRSGGAVLSFPAGRIEPDPDVWSGALQSLNTWVDSAVRCARLFLTTIDQTLIRGLATARPYKGLPNVSYPFHDKEVAVTSCGRNCFRTRKINLSQVFAGQTVGIKQTDEHIWLVSFMDYDLGYFDDEAVRLEPLANPFGPKVSPMSPVQSVT